MNDHHEEYKGRETEGFIPVNKLTVDQEAELRAHVAQCEPPYLTCDLCYELYSNIGYKAYEQLRLAIEAEHGPTESEQHL